jgi:hypothetical protein
MTREINPRGIAFWVMITIVIALCIYLIFWTKSESFECLSNPYTYSVGLLEKANDAEVSCLCSVNKEDGATVLLTKEGFQEVNYFGENRG